MTKKIALLLIGLTTLWPVMVVLAGGGSTPGSSFLNCGTSEPTINAAATTVMCDDFERTRNASNVEVTGTAPLNPGTAAVTNCDSPPSPSPQGEAYPPNKGWCVTDSGNASQLTSGVTQCGGAGANGSNCAAQQLNGGSNAMSHAFPATCISGGIGCATNGQTGAKEYTELYYRQMIKFVTGFALGSDGNQKLWTFNPGGNGTGGIVFGSFGMAGRDQNISFCPVMDCNYGADVGYRNPQNPQGCGNGGQYLCNNLNGGIAPINNHWWLWEVYIKKNTGNNRDGVLDVWYDDCGTLGTSCPASAAAQTQHMHYTNVAFTGNSTAFGPATPTVNSTNSLLGLNFMDVNTCCAGPSVGTVLIDNIVVSTTRIGPPGASLNPPPTAPCCLLGCTGPGCIPASMLWPTIGLAVSLAILRRRMKRRA